MTIRDALCSRANAGLINQGNHTYDNMLLVYMTQEPAIENMPERKKSISVAYVKRHLPSMAMMIWLLFSKKTEK